MNNRGDRDAGRRFQIGRRRVSEKPDDVSGTHGRTHADNKTGLMENA